MELRASRPAAGSVHVGAVQRDLDSCSDFSVTSQGCRAHQKGITEQKQGKQGRADRITQGQGYRPVCAVTSAHLVLQSGWGLREGGVVLEVTRDIAVSLPWPCRDPGQPLRKDSARWGDGRPSKGWWGPGRPSSHQLGSSAPTDC